MQSTLLGLIALALFSAPSTAQELDAAPTAAGDGAEAPTSAPATPELARGAWHAWLDSPGGDLPFGLDLRPTDQGWRAWIVNGTERIAIPRVTLDGGADPGAAPGAGVLGLHMDHYDSRITANVSGDGTRLDGMWEKRRGLDDWTRMPFHATAGEAPRFPLEGDFGLPGLTHEELVELGYTGTLYDEREQRWRVRFSTSEGPAVLVLRRPEGEADALMGTFLTTTGDYRYLAGRLGLDGLYLSCFDGAHAFLFRGKVEWPGMTGDFWSRDAWHETWTAEWDPYAALPDAFAQTQWEEDALLAELVFPDLDGRMRSLADPEFAGRARIVQVFGSWCPNCHDEAPFLAELHRRFEKRGLTITGLAFELTGDHERDAEQVRRYRDRYDIPFPLLIAGTADKTAATAALGVLDRVRSYPTTIFLHGDNTVASVHTGFMGPGTGAEHEALRAEFTQTIEGLLREKKPDDAPYVKWLEGRPWLRREAFGGASHTFRRDEKGNLVVVRDLHDRNGTAKSETFPVELARGVVSFADELWVIDRRAQVLSDPLDFGRRLSSDPKTVTPLLARMEIELVPKKLTPGLAHPDQLIRRECLIALAEWRVNNRERGLTEALDMLGEETAMPMRVAAAWAVGRTFEAGAVEALLANLDHPFARLRRESARSLARLATIEPTVREKLAERPVDYDPIVRKAIEAARR